MILRARLDTPANRRRPPGESLTDFREALVIEMALRWPCDFRRPRRNWPRKTKVCGPRIRFDRDAFQVTSVAASAREPLNDKLPNGHRNAMRRDPAVIGKPWGQTLNRPMCPRAADVSADPDPKPCGRDLVIREAAAVIIGVVRQILSTEL